MGIADPQMDSAQRQMQEGGFRMSGPQCRERQMARLKSLEEENRQLKRLIAELSLTKQLLQQSIGARR